MKKEGTASRVLARGGLAILLFLNAACDQFHYFLPSTVTVINQTSKTVTDVQITMADDVLWKGSLDPGEVHKVSGRPAGDGTVEIAFADQGHVFLQEFGYVTPGITEDHEIIILPSLEMKYTVQLGNLAARMTWAPLWPDIDLRGPAPPSADNGGSGTARIGQRSLLCRLEIHQRLCDH